VNECKPLPAGDRRLILLDRTRALRQGQAVQLDRIKPKLKPPETQRLKLKYVKLLSDFAFKFNLRRYTKLPPYLYVIFLTILLVDRAAGAYTRPLLSST
jgi:hypothetical protein